MLVERELKCLCNDLFLVNLFNNKYIEYEYKKLYTNINKFLDNNLQTYYNKLDKTITLRNQYYKSYNKLNIKPATAAETIVDDDSLS